MNHTKRVLLGLAGVAAFCATPSYAIPVVFDFAGTVLTRAHYDAPTNSRTFDDAAVGLAFTSQLILETDRFPATGTFTDAFAFRDLFLPTGIASTSPWLSSLNVGGNAIDVGIYDLNYAYVELQDTKNPAVGDSLLVVARSDKSGPLGVTNSSLLQLIAFETFNGSTPPGYIDLDQAFDINSLLTIALPNLRFAYGTSSFDCQALNLCFLAASDTTDFLVTSVTRSVGGVTAVPEPGTFGLFAGALFGMWMLARRRKGAFAN